LRILGDINRGGGVFKESGAACEQVCEVNCFCNDEQACEFEAGADDTYCNDGKGFSY